MVLIIGVAGSIATGKSSACDILVGMGAEHCDADRLVHRLYDPGKPAFYRITEIFGEEIVGEDGYIDRKILGTKVFGKPKEMNKLTSAIGDINAAVKGVIDEWRASSPETGMALMEAVNLIEAGYGQWCDQVWLFACSDDSARARLMARNGFTEAEANQRLSSQRSWEDRAPASDLIIFNDSSLEEFYDQVRQEFAKVQEIWNKGELEQSKFQEWWANRVRQSS